MVTTAAHSRTGSTGLRGALARWPRWVAYAAVIWSLVYGVLGVYWALGGPGFPFGPSGDRVPMESNLGGIDARTGGIATALIGLSGVIVGLIMARTSTRATLPRILLIGYAGVVAGLLILLVPDRRLLMFTAYVPILLFMGVKQLIDGGSVPMVDPGMWTIFSQAAAAVGGMLWLGSAVAYANRNRTTATPPRWSTPESARRWGRWAVGVAVVVPLLYAATRWAWALGIPLGISDEFYRQGAESGLWWAGAALATLGIGGAILTLGLAQRWGEVYPRLIWWRAGRPVPRMLAVIPATVVSIMTTTAGIEYWRLVLTNTAPLEESWTTMGPELLWPLWGIALAAATLAYNLRRKSGGPVPVDQPADGPASTD